MKCRVLLLVVAVLLASAVGLQGADADAEKQYNEMLDKAVKYLRGAQQADGSWSPGRFTPGVSGVVVTGLLQSGKVTTEDPMVAKGLAYIESLANKKEGHLAGADPKVQLKNYVTSVNVMALVAAKRADKYEKIIGDATKFLKQLQWDDAEGKGPKDDFFGGAGYDSKSRPDLSNTQMFLDALKAAGIPPTDPAYKNALIFVSRCQNLKSEFNDQPWAGKIDDGSFIYSAAGGGQSKVGGSSPDTGLIGYGSMTYAGIKSMIYCGVGKDDPRMKKAVDWIKKNYTVDRNPGMLKIDAERGLYYYYHSMAKALHALGVDEIVDDKGVKHDWRADIRAALAKRQKPDGSWVNEQDGWFEGDPALVTGYALMALSYCKPK
ncbi:MAG: prenyltransferase/squalene oxidase repeat-containing protein [Gemmataceae bacterium]